MIRTYADAGVLIAASRGEAPIARRALEILDDPEREFASSVFLRLELLPKAIYYRNTLEAEFYEEFFASVTHWADALEAIVHEAYQEACASGLAAMDALHIAAAVSVGSQEFVTSERPEKPIHRVRSLVIVSIHPDRVG